MTQNQIQTLHNHTMTQIQMYASGLITLPELIKSIGEVGEAVARLGVDGLIDPSTGLRFP
jgi:hypothetical protein